MTTSSPEQDPKAELRQSPWIPWLWGAAGILALGLGTIPLLWPMIQRGYPITHSTHFNLSWGFQYQYQFLSGQWYPRWLEFSNFGFGNATFAFYPPLCMVATLPFRLLGFDLAGSLVGSMGLAIGLLGLGLYGYARCWFARWIAVGVAAMGMTAPYFLVDIYQRGAIGEVWAIVTLPWILWMTQQAITGSAIPPERPEPQIPEQIPDHQPQPKSRPKSGPTVLFKAVLGRLRPDPWRVIRLGVAYGMLVLSHLPTLLIFTLVWIPLPWLVAERGQRWRGVVRAYGGAGLALGWTGFYLWPAALDQRFVQVASVNAIPEYVPQERLMVKGLLQLRPVLTDHWFEKGLLGSLGQTVAVLLISGGILLFVLGRYHRAQTAQFNGETRDPGVPSSGRRQNVSISGTAMQVLGSRSRAWERTLGSLPPVDRITLYWLGAAGLAVLMMTDLLGWIYPWLTVLKRIQFSWRWMAITAVLGPLLVGSLLHRADKLAHRSPRQPHWIAALGILALGWGGWGVWQGIEVPPQAFYQPTTIQQFVELAQQKSFPDEPQERPGTNFLYWHWIMPDGLALVDVPEYRARGVTLPMPPPQVDPLLRWEAVTHPEPDPLAIEHWQLGRRQFRANNRSTMPQGVLVRTFYYPAWRVRLDHRWIPTERTGQGQLRVTIPPGDHTVTVVYLGTMMDWIGRTGSLVTLLLTLLLLLAAPINRTKDPV